MMQPDYVEQQSIVAPMECTPNRTDAPNAWSLDKLLAHNVQLYRMACLVIDTSALLAVLLNESARSALIRATEGYGLVGAPSLPWEVGNALVAGFRRHRLSAAQVRQAWASYQTVPVRLADINAEHALAIAVEAGLYAYDAYVLETARAEQLPLLTLDRRLARAAHQLGLRMMEYEE